MAVVINEFTLLFLAVIVIAVLWKLIDKCVKWRTGRSLTKRMCGRGEVAEEVAETINDLLTVTQMSELKELSAAGAAIGPVLRATSIATQIATGELEIEESDDDAPIVEVDDDD